MRIREILSENPTIADVIRSAAQPTPQQGTQSPGTTPNTGTQPAGTVASKVGQKIDNLADKAAGKLSTDINKDASGNKINFASAVASKSLYSKDGSEKDQQVDLTKIPPAQIQAHLRPGQQVDLGNLGKVKVGQVTPQGVEFDGTGTPIGAKFTVPFKTLGQQ